jgi:cytoskeletal protein RodZ
MDATRDHLAEQQNPEVSHERSDVNVRGILMFGVALLVVAIIIHLFIWWLFDHFAMRAAQSGRPFPATVARATGEPVPPEPRLQVSPADDLQEMHAAEDVILNNYGWEDQQAGVVRIPIDRALQILAERGLPVQSSTADSETEKRRSGETGKPENR